MIRLSHMIRRIIATYFSTVIVVDFATISQNFIDMSDETVAILWLRGSKRQLLTVLL